MEYDIPLRKNDPALFGRVWQRVMPEAQADCPITPIAPPSPPPPAAGRSEEVARVPEITAPVVAAPAASGLCLCGAPESEGARLQEFVAHKLTVHRRYLSLAKRVSTRPAKILTSLANDELRHAKRLSTAYFLIFGDDYWPAPRSASSAGTSLRVLLRECFIDEQQSRARALAASGNTGDPCLRELYLDLMGDDTVHAQLLRSILEEL